MGYLAGKKKKKVQCPLGEGGIRIQKEQKSLEGLQSTDTGQAGWGLETTQNIDGLQLAEVSRIIFS